MTILLFPGRHLLNSAFQAEYLRRILKMPLDQLGFFGSQRPAAAEPIDQIVFAITSANQENSRFNPIPFHVRAIGVDRFARALESAYGISYRIIGIPHYRPTHRFGEIVLKEIEAQTEGNLSLTPENCVVLCSTPTVMKMYQEMGFGILPAEMEPGADMADTPTKLMEKMVRAGESWSANGELRRKLSPATYDLWHDFPDIPIRILRLWRDPLINDAGSLTDDRDYSTYASGMSNQAIIELKYNDIKPALLAGKIVDEGCADGALLAQLARDFPDSDLVGIEITGEFLARCRERQRAGEFGGTFVHFHQRNITQPIFQPGSIDSTICNSTVHELWSYGDQAATVNAYLAKKYRQTARGGRLIIRDVVGPSALIDNPFEGGQEVAMWLATDDGSNEDIFRVCSNRETLRDHLSQLSTYGRFLRFARDFLAEARARGRRGPETEIQFRPEEIEGVKYIWLSLRAAAEFISKKDYTDNWDSEMNEEFAFWSFSQWKQGLSQAGFHVVENPNEPESGSRVYTSSWMVKHRFEGKVKLFRLKRTGMLSSIPFPVTNVILVGEKRS